MGSKLTATVTPEGATATYKWKRADSSGGQYSDIASATSAEYTLATEDEGKFIKVEATGTDKYNGTVLSQATTAVAGTE